MAFFLQRLFYRFKKLIAVSGDPFERFALRLLQNKCTHVRITPLFAMENGAGKSICITMHYEYALLFESVTSGEEKKRPIRHREVYMTSDDPGNRRNNTLELFLYAERRRKDLKNILPDITAAIIGLEGKPMNDRGINTIRAEAQMRNVAIL